MGTSRISLAAAVFSASVIVPLVSLVAIDPSVANAAMFRDITAPIPGSNEEFGSKTLVLSNGNIVVTDPYFDFPGASDGGGVFLYDGSDPTGAPLTIVVGGNPDDHIGSDGVVEVGNSNFVIVSPDWDGPATDVGAVTWVSGSTPAPLVQTDSTNSIIGGTNFDHVGLDGITVLTNGNYVVASGDWDGAFADVGAVTWANGNVSTGLIIDDTNSLVGASLNDAVGYRFGFAQPVTALTGGNYVVVSPEVDYIPNTLFDVGAVTLGNGVTGSAGFVNATNSILGAAAGDSIGVSATALTNGNYVVNSPGWSSGRGASTWMNGSTSTTGTLAISSANSIVGSFAGDTTGLFTAALSNGNYAVGSPGWNGGYGAVTIGQGTGGPGFAVDEANSLVGSSPGDLIGFGLSGSGLVPLDNGRLVVASPSWNASRGAATLVDGASGLIDTVSAANSLVGQRFNDEVGSNTVALAGGRYAVGSPSWSTGAATALGAVTIVDSAIGLIGPVTVGNSFHGTTAGDAVGTSVTALTNGNVVVGSPSWDAPSISNAGAVTWISASSGLISTPSATNSLIGGTVNDHLGGNIVIPLVNGGYLTYSSDYDTFTSDAGVATYGGLRGVVGTPNTLNSVFGPTTGGLFIPCTCSPAGNKLLPDGSVPVGRTDNVVTLLRPDQTAPTLTQPADISAEVAPGTTSKVLTFTMPTATDPESSPPPTVSCDRASGSAFPVGATTVTCTAVNEVGLTTTKTFTATVTVLAAPVFSGVPPNMTIATAPGGSTATLTYTAPTATDAHGAVTVTCTPTSGATLPVGATTVTCSATNLSTATATFTATVSATALNADVVPITPARLADTRPAHTTADGLFAGIGALDNGATLELTVRGRGGVSADASAVALNVTVTEPTAAGFVTIYPCGATRPTASNVNFVAGQTIANASVAKIGTGGAVCIYASRSTQLVVDASGSFPPTSAYVALEPSRVLDTRESGGPVDTKSVTPLQIAGRATVPADAKAVVLNVTVTEPVRDGYVTVYPCGTEPPTASNLNFIAGQTIANLVVAKLGTGGQVCLYSQHPTQLVVDVQGYFPAAATYVPLDPARLLETRPDLPTVDGAAASGGLRTPGSVTILHVAGRGGVAASAVSVVLNVTVTGPVGSGYLTVYPCGATPPNASNLNFVAGQTIANAVITKVGTGGDVCILTSQPAHVVVDVTGFMPV